MAEPASLVSRSRWPTLLTGYALCLGSVLCGCESKPRSPSIDFGAEDVAAHRLGASQVEPSLSSPPSVVAEELRPDDWFEDVTRRSGINFVYRNGCDAQRYFLIESFGGGVSMIDFDMDGDVDLFFTVGGTITKEPEPPLITGLPPGLL